eukprot:Hpha_TRINITY_DN15847_c2_g5::TRINITY_DN15847_c2_g5_i4::g.191608::m.191608
MTMLPFNSDDVRKYVTQIIARDVRALATSLQSAPEGEVAKPIAAMRSVPLTTPQAVELQRALRGSGSIHAKRADLLRHFIFYSDKGGVRLRRRQRSLLERWRGGDADTTGDDDKISAVWDALEKCFVTKVDGVEVSTKADVKQHL